MTRDDEVTSARLMVLEYERIKDEQRTRIGFRDNLLYVTLAAMATVIAVSASARDPSYVLLLPPVSRILGWTYLANDEKISAIGRYIRGELAPRLAAQTGDDSVIFGWETIHRSDARRSPRKFLQVGWTC
ncbi:MAG: putative integral rane protein [Actinoallomurus sp.]|nr:putative integral rane protein [Actinoallomurus sp.]